MNAGPSAEDRETEANTVATLHARAPYLVWHAYGVSFDGVRDDTRRGLATPIASVSPHADRRLPPMAKVFGTVIRMLHIYMSVNKRQNYLLYKSYT